MKYLLGGGLLFTGLFTIYIYLYFIKHHYSGITSCKDILNARLVQNIDLCGWDILHVLFFYSLCLVLNTKYDIFRHILIFIIGLFWFLFEKYFLDSLNDNIQCNDPNYIYKNIYEPKIMDIFFNLFGQLLYIITQIYLRKK